MLASFLQSRPRTRKPRQPARMRLLPAAMATAGALLGLKAVAMAQDVANAPATPPAQQDAQAQQPAQSTTTATTAAAAAPTCSPSIAEQAGLSQSEVQVLQALGARRDALDARAAEMDTNTELLTAAEHRLDERLAQLHQLQDTVTGLLGQLDEAQEHRLAALVDVYQRMRAKDAAAVFDGLNDTVLVQVASRMRQQNLAEVMGKMQPARARALTQMLAEQSRPPADAAALLQQAQSGARAPAANAAPAAGR